MIDDTQTMLTKSDFAAGSQCTKRLYLRMNHPELKAASDGGIDRRATDGIEVGKLGRQYYPGGQLIEWSGGDPVGQSAMAIESGSHCLYEASFQSGTHGLLVRCDILRLLPDSQSEWHLIEVKSSAEKKPEHVIDAAYQTYVARLAGLTISRISILHINNSYVYGGGEYDVKQLFTEVDITAEVDGQMAAIVKTIDTFRQLIAGPTAPQIETNRHCTKAPCEFHEYCHKDQPEHDVIQLPRISAKQVTEYRANGYRTILNLPHHEVKPHWQIIWQVVRAGIPYFSSNLGSALSEVVYPLHFIDFESVACALPIYAGTRPYQQVPFQWSNHRVDAPGGAPYHMAFLHQENNDPRFRFAETLWNSVQDAGTIFVYSRFEASRLKDLASDGVPFAAELSTKLASCVVDILKVVKDHVYHPAFNGSFSVKKVLPALVPELSYEGLPIHDGDTASLRFLEMQGFRPTDQLVDKIATDLLDYCCLDTLAMVKIFDTLYITAGQNKAQ